MLTEKKGEKSTSSIVNLYLKILKRARPQVLNKNHSRTNVRSWDTSEESPSRWSGGIKIKSKFGNRTKMVKAVVKPGNRKETSV